MHSCKLQLCFILCSFFLREGDWNYFIVYYTIPYHHRDHSYCLPDTTLEYKSAAQVLQLLCGQLLYQSLWNKGLLLNVWSPHRICRAFPACRTRGSHRAKMFDVWSTVIPFTCLVAFIWSMQCYQSWPWCGPVH